MTGAARTLAAGLMLALLLAVAAPADAFWRTTGSGTATATSGTLTAATISTPATTGSGAVTVSITSGATLPGNPGLNGAITYRIERAKDSGGFAAVAGGGCSGALPASTSSCSDTVSSAGTYHYRAVAVYETWTATSNTSDTATRFVDHFDVSMAANVTAGASTAVTVTAKDVTNATVTGYAGTVQLSSTDGAATLPGAYTFQGADNGVHTFNVTLRTAGSRAVTATDTGTTSVTGSASTTVAAAAPAGLVFTRQPNGGQAQAVFSSQPRVAIVDAFGNQTTSTASVSLALLTTGTLSCTATSLAATAGVADFAGCKVDKAGTHTIRATSGGLTSADSDTFTVTVGPVASLSFTQQPSGASGGTAFTTQPKVTALDAGGNVVTAFATNVTLAITSGTGTAGATLSTCPPTAPTAGVVSFSGCKIDKAGTGYTLTATGASLSAVSSAFAVTVGPVASITVSGGSSPQSATINTAFGTALQALVTDAGNNPISGAGVLFSAPTSGATGTFPGASPTASVNTAANGIATAPAFTANGTAGPYNITATTGVLSVDFALTNVKANQTITFTSTAPTTNPAVGATYTVTATGGASGNPVTFASSTPTACTVSGSTVTVAHSGTCTVTAAQAGNGNYNAANQVQQSFSVGLAITGAAPSPGKSATFTGKGTNNGVQVSVKVCSNFAMTSNCNNTVVGTQSSGTWTTNATGNINGQTVYLQASTTSPSDSSAVYKYVEGTTTVTLGP